MRNVHIFMTGPLRPSLRYIVDNIYSIKSLFGNVITHILYWKTNSSDITELKQSFDFVYAIDEPSDEEIFEKITGRTGQQRHLKTLEHWTLSTYKMFYGIRKLIHASKIEDSDIIIRIRTDLYFDMGKNITNIINDIQSNSYYFCPRANGGNSCDWFSISDFRTFKTVWYFRNDSQYNDAISKTWTAETLILNKAKQGEVRLIDINQYIKIAICRGFNENTPILTYMHP